MLKAVELTVTAIRDDNQKAAESVLMLKDEVRRQSEALLARKATSARLWRELPSSLRTMAEINLMERGAFLWR